MAIVRLLRKSVPSDVLPESAYGKNHSNSTLISKLDLLRFDRTELKEGPDMKTPIVDQNRCHVELASIQTGVHLLSKYALESR